MTFLAISHSTGGRTYTYADAEGVAAVGDRVEVETKHGLTTGIVEAVVGEPSFECRPVMRVVETAAEREARKEAEGNE